MGLTATGGPCVLAVDGGNSKSDVAVASWDGELLALERGPGFRPHVDGVERSVDALAPAVDAALARAGRPAIALVKAALANADLPVEEERIAADLRRRGWGERVDVVNDTFAVLRAGTDEPRGVAVVCGAGINAVGVSPTNWLNLAENEPRLANPTAMHTSVTVRFAARNKSCARSMRLRVRYRIGVSP